MKIGHAEGGIESRSLAEKTECQLGKGTTYYIYLD